MTPHHIYLDHSASTPVAPEVLAAMLPYFSEQYGNSASLHHHGREAAKGLEKARRVIAGILHCQANEIIFTGNGSESDNLALRGVMWAARKEGRNHLIISAIEHGAVAATAHQLGEQFGCETTVLPVNNFGLVEIETVRAAIRPTTALISIMAANNEIGTIQPYEAIGALAHEHNILFHTDGVQVAPYLPFDLSKQPIDLLSIASHKMYGPKGVGILFVRDGIELESSLTGGGHEGGRRAGTVNVAFAVGAAAALQLTMVGIGRDTIHYTKLRDRLIAGILAAIPAQDCQLSGHPTHRLPQHASFAFRNISGNDILIHLDIAGISVSSASACDSGDPKPSAALQAMGFSPNWTTGGLRLTVGRQNTIAEIDTVIQKLPRIVAQLKTFRQRMGD